MGVFKTSSDKRGKYEAMHRKKKKEKRKQEEQIARSRTVIRGNVALLRSSHIGPAGTRGPSIKMQSQALTATAYDKR